MEKVVPVGESEPPVEEYDTSLAGGVLASLPVSVRGLPADLSLLLILNLATVVTVVVPSLEGTPLRTVLGASFVLFVPGYAVVSALFPEANGDRRERTTAATRRSAEPPRRSVDGPERALLSIALSAVVAGLSGFGLHLMPLRLRPLTVLVPLTAVTVVATLLAVRRRGRIPHERRFRVPYRTWIATVRASSDGPTATLAVNALLALSVVLACSALGLALLFPQDGETFTEFYLLTADGDGEFRAGDYPHEFTVNGTRTVHAAVHNRERRPRNYTVVVELHRLEGDGNTSTVVESERIVSTDLRLRHNETAIEPIPVAPRTTGVQLRLTFLLYAGDPPREPRVGNAYRETHLWVNVSAPPANGSLPSDRVLPSDYGAPTEAALRSPSPASSASGAFDREHPLGSGRPARGERSRSSRGTMDGPGIDPRDGSVPDAVENIIHPIRLSPTWVIDPAP